MAYVYIVDGKIFQLSGFKSAYQLPAKGWGNVKGTGKSE